MKKIKTLKRSREMLPVPVNPLNSQLTLAELSLQRGDFDHARRILEERLTQGNVDFRTHNLYAISLAQIGYYPEALSVHRAMGAGLTKTQKIKADFNRGLIHFFQTLNVVDDLSILRDHLYGGPSMMIQDLSPDPFRESIDIWEKLLKGRAHHEDIILPYLSFAYLQSGDLSKAIDRIMSALAIHENFYIMHYVLGRIFLDLYHLAVEGSDFMLPQNVLDFFEVESYEIGRRDGELCSVQKETLLDIALQALLECRSLNPMCVANLLVLCHARLIAGMFEEAEDDLNHLDIYAPETVPTMQMTLRFHEAIMSPPKTIKALIKRLETAMRKPTVQYIDMVMPPYYLF